MVVEGDASHSKSIPPYQAHQMRRDRAIIKLQEKVRKLTKELEQVRGSTQ